MDSTSLLYVHDNKGYYHFLLLTQNNELKCIEGYYKHLHTIINVVVVVVVVVG
jgi:hypothetical protein